MYLLIGLVWLWFIVNSVEYVDSLFLYVYWLVGLLLIVGMVCWELLLFVCFALLIWLIDVVCVTLLLFGVVMDWCWWCLGCGFSWFEFVARFFYRLFVIL